MTATSQPPYAVTAYIALGSNLDDPQSHVRQAMAELNRLPVSQCTAYSSLYRSPPMGPQDQPEYINAVVRLGTDLSAVELLNAMQSLEWAHGRRRQSERRWGARTLDLDLLLYGEQSIQTDRLQVPHPGMADRDFVLRPLYEIEPHLQVPGLGPVRVLVRRCRGGGLYRVVS